VSHFAVSYHNEAARLGINLDDLYSALLADGELNPPEWNTEGRQVNVYKYVVSLLLDGLELTYYFRQFGYVPFAVLDVSSTGRQTREGSRTLEASVPSCRAETKLKYVCNSMHSRTSVSAKLLSYWVRRTTLSNTPIALWYALRIILWTLVNGGLVLS
jgi:hypothetical protein